MASSVYPVPYSPRVAPTLPGGEMPYLRQELLSVQTTLDGVLSLLPRVATIAPAVPRVGMIRKAMSPWRPVSGQSSDRWVIYDGLVWTYFA